MNLDEAIAHAREVAEENIQKSREMTKDPFCVINLDKIEVCNKCAEEHEQLAEWLEELKELRKLKETYAKGMETSYAEFRYEQGGADAIEKLIKNLCIGCAYLNGTKCENKRGCPCLVGQSEIIRSANKVLEQLKESKNE